MSDNTTSPWRPWSELIPIHGMHILAPSEWAGTEIDEIQYDETRPNGHAWWSVKIEMPVDEPDWWMSMPPPPPAKERS